MSDYLENEDLKFTVQLQSFANALPAYAATFGLTPAEVEAVQADSEFSNFVITRNDLADNYRQNWTKLKNEMRYGMDVPVISPFPAPIDLSDAPPTVPPGVEKRFRELVKRIKAHPNYTKGIGEALGIEKDETVFNPAEGKPKFKISLDAGSPVLKWTKGRYEGVDVWVNRGTGFVKAERDLRPPFVDKHPLPAAGESAVWEYKMIYVLKDEPIGQWSDEAKVTVFGAV